MRKTVALTLGLVATASLSAPMVTPQGVRQDIEKSGPKAVVDHLFASGAYERVMAGMAAGSRQWIALAPLLSDGADAASAEELSNALVYALPKAPEAVLSAIDVRPRSVSLSIDSICTPAFFEGDPTDPVRWKAGAIRAVRSVIAPRLQATKGRCLGRLAKA